MTQLAPCHLIDAQSFDEPAKQAEKSTERFVSAIAGGEGKLWWEPEGKEGMIDELLGSRRISNPRVLDVGESETLIGRSKEADFESLWPTGCGIAGSSRLLFIPPYDSPAELGSIVSFHLAGVWISAVASSYPGAEVVGLDLVGVEG